MNSLSQTMDEVEKLGRRALGVRVDLKSYHDVKVTANYIQMQGTSPADRWRGGVGGGDPAGQLCTVNGIRLQKPRGSI